jgi:arylsulfatase A-like enzyme
MKRLLSPLFAGAVVALALSAGSSPGPARADARLNAEARLNVVVILADDERWDSNARMRNVQLLLARHGVTFTNAFVTTSECCPSRASILCGQYAHTTGVIQNFGPSSYPHFYEKSNLATWLHDSGYTTALVGKYLNDYTIYGHHHVPPGWSSWQAIDSVPEEAYYDYTLNANGRLVPFGARASDYSTDVLGRKARQFAARAKEPFFLYFTPIAPHLPAIPAERDIATPLVLPEPRRNFNERDITDKPWSEIYRRVLGPNAVHYLDRQIEGRQLRSLRELDRQVGALVRALKRRGVLDRTVIIYMSDNGFLWGEHRLGGKIWPYEESIRVPLVVRVPWLRSARTDRHMVLNIDLASTIAELARVKPQLPQDGRSIAPLLHGQAVTNWRTQFEVEYLGASQYQDGGPPPFRALRTSRWLYVQYLNGWRELYDLQRDRFELRNLARDHGTARLQAELRRRLDLLASARPTRP